MRAQGLGIVLAVGEGSKFKVGDHVTGAWGMDIRPVVVGLCGLIKLYRND